MKYYAYQCKHKPCTDTSFQLMYRIANENTF